jgi:cleavage stimulation factor subunit 3
MAEDEIALLHRLQAGQESGTWEDDGTNGAVEGEQPSFTEDNEQDKKETVADDQVQRALSPSGSGVVTGGGDLSSVIPAVKIAGEEESRSSSRASARPRPRVVGGFIADDSDEETDDSSLQVAANPNRTLSPSPLASSITQQEVQSVTNNGTGSFPSNALPVISSGAAPASVQTAQAPALSTALIAKARLPHDTMGILEDRIKDDPKGDIEAWLSLITEYRNRHKLEEAGNTYERFLRVFPQAVSIFTCKDLDNANICRARYGLPTRRWRSNWKTSPGRKRSFRDR